MSQRQAGLELLVAVGEEAFGSAVVDALETTGGAAVAARVQTATDALARAKREEVDGVLVDDR
jgi:hypothetical protein